jgi:hypothetical protein
MEGVPNVPSAYHLAFLPLWKIHLVFHMSLLQPTQLNTCLHPLVTDKTCLTPELSEGEEEFEIKDILDHQGGKHH